MTLGTQFESVLAAAQTGEEWAVAGLYRDLHPAVLRYLIHREPAEAEDLAAEAWIDVAGALPGFQGDEHAFRRLVFSIARRRLIDHRRRRGRRRTDPVPTESLGPLPGGDAEDEAVTRLSTRELLDRIVASLPEDQAEVVLLRVIGGFTAEEVGAIIGRRAGTVRVLQHRALSRLARILSLERVTP